MPELPPVLYKYMSRETAEKVLESRSLQWSRLDRFNDPFERQDTYLSNLDHAELRAALVELLIDAAFGPADIPNTLTGGLLDVAREVRAGTRPLSKAAFRAQLEPLTASVSISGIAGETAVALEQSVQFIIDHCRVLCLTESCVSTLMWTHYAGEGKGVCLGFRSQPALDWMNEIRAVTYESRPRVVASASQWARAILFKAPPSGEQQLENLFLVKTKDWEYEREWRVVRAHRPIPPEDKEGRLIVPWGQVELVELLFGLAFPAGDRASVAAMARTCGRVRCRQIVRAKHGIGFDVIDLDM